MGMVHLRFPHPQQKERMGGTSLGIGIGIGNDGGSSSSLVRKMVRGIENPKRTKEIHDDFEKSK